MTGVSNCCFWLLFVVLQSNSIYILYIHRLHTCFLSACCILNFRLPEVGVELDVSGALTGQASYSVTLPHTRYVT